MGNSPPRIKLHYVKEEDRVLTGLIQILDSSNNKSHDDQKQSGGRIPPPWMEELEVYVIGREKISWVAANNFMTLKESHTFFMEKVIVKATDMEPTFSIPLPADLPPSGHGGNYGKGLGYAIGYHVLVEVKGCSDISAIEVFTVALGKNIGAGASSTIAAAEVDNGSMKFGKRILEYEIPKIMPRGTNQTIKLKLSEGVNQRVRIRLREVGKQLKGQEQAQSEIKYELDEEVIGTEWTPINILISKYANTARQGVVLQISHVLEITAIGGTQSVHYVNIPITLG